MISRISCNSCAEALEEKLESLSNVEHAQVSPEDGATIVQGTATLAELRKVLADYHYKIN